MKKLININKPVLIFLIIFFLIFIYGCETDLKITKSQSDTHISKKFITLGTDHLDLYEGLHITGTPIEVDVDDYRLTVSGSVNEKLSLTFDEIKNLGPISEYVELECPVLFVDRGVWTGIPVRKILELAEIKSGAEIVEFISIDGSYKVPLSIEEAKEDGVLLAYEFNGKEFSKYHGFPLRLVVRGKDGSYWVKWLGEIRVNT